MDEAPLKNAFIIWKTP